MGEELAERARVRFSAADSWARLAALFDPKIPADKLNPPAPTAAVASPVAVI